MADGNHIQIGLGGGDLTFSFNDRFGSCGVAHFFKGLVDFDGDGNLDFALPCAGDGRVGIYLGRGDGTFKQKKLVVPDLCMNVVTGDFNRDGKPDLAVAASPGGISKVWVYLGDGRGGFAPAPGAPYSVGYTSGNQFTTFLEVGDFASANPDGTHSLASDGVLDVAVSNSAVNYHSSSVSVLVGNGGGTLTNASDLGSPFNLGGGTAYKTWGLVSGDWNNDGKRDLAVAGGDPNVIPGKVTILLHA